MTDAWGLGGRWSRVLFGVWFGLTAAAGCYLVTVVESRVGRLVVAMAVLASGLFLSDVLPATARRSTTPAADGGPHRWMLLGLMLPAPLLLSMVALSGGAGPTVDLRCHPDVSAQLVDFTYNLETHGEAYAYVLDYGDGKIDRSTTGDGLEAPHHYARPGSYTATLTVIDQEGSTSDRCRITV